jgi:hypothetical protein
VKRTLRFIGGVIVTLLALGMLGLDGCDHNGARAQVNAAEGTALAFNRALPLWVGVAERECTGVVDAAPNRAAAARAQAACEARWRTVSTAWEASRLSHRVWSAAALACQAATLDGGPEARCMPDVRAALGAFTDHVTEFRCALRANGHEELDQLPGEPECSRDGGVR